MRRKWQLAVVSAASVLGAVACGNAQPTTPEPPGQEPSAARLLDADGFAAAIAEPGRITINVHVPFEGNIPDTDLSIPFDQIDAQADRLPADRATSLAVYCRSGPMSTTAAETLQKLGYTDIVDLRGGMRAWAADGRPLSDT